MNTCACVSRRPTTRRVSIAGPPRASAPNGGESRKPNPNDDGPQKPNPNGDGPREPASKGDEPRAPAPKGPEWLRSSSTAPLASAGVCPTTGSASPTTWLHAPPAHQSLVTPRAPTSGPSTQCLRSSAIDAMPSGLLPPLSNYGRAQQRQRRSLFHRVGPSRQTPLGPEGSTRSLLLSS